jgi:hypothetical protein
MLRDNATAPAASKPNLKRDATHSRTMALMTAWACMVTYSSPNACPPSRLLSHAPPTVHTLDMMIFPAHPGGGVGYQPLCMYVPREKNYLRLRRACANKWPRRDTDCTFRSILRGRGRIILLSVVFQFRGDIGQKDGDNGHAW